MHSGTRSALPARVAAKNPAVIAREAVRKVTEQPAPPAQAECICAPDATNGYILPMRKFATVIILKTIMQAVFGTADIPLEPDALIVMLSER